jgi:hypothetical protein
LAKRKKEETPEEKKARIAKEVAQQNKKRYSRTIRRAQKRKIESVQKFSEKANFSGRITVKVKNEQDALKTLKKYGNAVYGFQVIRQFNLSGKKGSEKVTGYSTLETRATKATLQRAQRDCKRSAFRTLDPDVRYEKDGSPSLVSRKIQNTSKGFVLMLYLKQEARQTLLGEFQKITA